MNRQKTNVIMIELIKTIILTTTSFFAIRRHRNHIKWSRKLHTHFFFIFFGAADKTWKEQQLNHKNKLLCITIVLLRYISTIQRMSYRTSWSARVKDTVFVLAGQLAAVLPYRSRSGCAFLWLPSLRSGPFTLFMFVNGCYLRFIFGAGATRQSQNHPLRSPFLVQSVL